MNLFRYTHSYGSAYSLEELQAILRFDKIGSGNYFHCFDAETEDGYVLAPKMNLPAKNNFAPVVTASLHEAEQEEKSRCIFVRLVIGLFLASWFFFSAYWFWR